MFSLFDDLRFGFRLLSGRIGFAAVAVLTLALGISVTTAVFSILDTMYWKAFPGAVDPDRLVELESVAPDGSFVRSSWLDYREYRDRLRRVAGVAAYDDVVLNVGDSEEMKPVRGELVSSNYFTVLGVKAALGRVFSRDELSDSPGANPVAVISYAFWKNEFQASAAVLGKTVRVNRHNLTIIGVAPPEFRGAMGGTRSDLWAPLTMGVELASIEKDTFRDSTLRSVYMFARLAPGTAVSEAQAEIATVARHVSAIDPVGHQGFGATLEPMWRAQIHGRTAFLQPLLILMAVSLLVLIIACANVSNLLLGRSVTRLQEFGVRVALGAGRWRVARLICAETLLLSAGGAIVGVPLALWLTDSVALLLPPMARADALQIDVDGRVLGFAILMCVGAALASSTAPALFVLRSDVNETLREGGRSGRAGTRSHSLRWALVISEIALAQLVLIGAGLFYRGYRNAAKIDPGFDRNGVLLANFSIAGGGYSVQELEGFCFRLREQLARAPGIESATYADYAPLWSTDGAYTTTRPEGFLPRNPADLKVHRTSVAPGYFSLLRIPLLEGRDFTENDDRNAEAVMIVDQAFARRFYAGASPVGRRVQIRKRWITIVGLVRDSKYFSVTDAPRPHFYLPFRQSYQSGQQILFFVRTTGGLTAAVAALRKTAPAVDPGAASFTAAPLAEYNDMLLLPRKLGANLLNSLGVIAFILAGVGLYGVMSYSVAQRTQELGIRMALGARPKEVVGVIIRQAMLITCIGAAIGSVLSLASMRLLASLLVGISPFDPLTFVSASLFIFLIAAAASFLPAHRATRLDPFTALRSE